MLERIGISYADFQTKQSGKTIYYTEDANKYQAILINTGNNLLMVCDLNKINDRPNVAHFEATYKGTATQVGAVDEVVAKSLG